MSLPRHGLHTFWVILIALMLGGCPDPTPPPPPLGLRITDVIRTLPPAGDPDQREIIEVRWAYDTPGRLALQAIRLHTVLFKGDLFSVTRGCLPQEMLQPGEAVGACLPLDKTSHTFRFPGPVTFHVIAKDDNQQFFEKFVKITIPGLAFRLTPVSFVDSRYPTLPLQVPNPNDNKILGEIVFDHAFGIFSASDTQGDDSIIDGLAILALAEVFGPDHIYLSETLPPTNERADGTFVKALGRQFPALPGEFLNSANGTPFRGVRNFADVIVIATGLGISGTYEKIRTASGDVEIITGALQPFVPVVVQVNIRSSTDGTNQLFCADIYLGNIGQGLTVAAFRNHVPPAGATPGSLGTCNAQFIDIPGFGPGSNGSANDVIAGLQVRRLDDFLLAPAQSQFNITWTNIPLFADNNLTPLINSQFTNPDLMRQVF